MSILINGMAMPQNCNECRMMEIIDREDGTFRYICIAHLNEIVNLKERLETCPLEEVQEPKRGKWIFCRTFNDWDIPLWQECGCTECKTIVQMPPRFRYPYCPNCGAKMERSEDAD